MSQDDQSSEDDRNKRWKRTEQPRPEPKPTWARGMTSDEIDAAIGPLSSRERDGSAQSGANDPPAKAKPFDSAATPIRSRFAARQKRMEERAAKIDAKEQAAEKSNSIQSRFLDEERER